MQIKLSHFSLILAIIASSVIMQSCREANEPSSEELTKTDVLISKSDINALINEMNAQFAEQHENRIRVGVTQVAALWRESDGSAADFKEFCKKNFISDEAKLSEALATLESNQETLNGYFNEITLALKSKLDLQQGEITPLDEMYAAYDVTSHMKADFYDNKIAFFVSLNFPFYSLKDKDSLGMDMSDTEWAMMRAGDLFTSRVPASIAAELSAQNSQASQYIAEYNIAMDRLTDSSGKQFFPDGMMLISHWNLRDEIKSQYSNLDDGLVKQDMIYRVMERIISQEIPQEVINNDEYHWDPFRNVVSKDGSKHEFSREDDIRYKHLLDAFHIMQEIDKYSDKYPTYIARKFEEEMEIPQEQVESLFMDFLSSPEMKEVAELIKMRLGRGLRPYDIWYDGFKSRASLSEDKLNEITLSKYPNTDALSSDIPNILKKLGFETSRANSIASLITVDAARGAGHAWGAQMKNAQAHLRSRFTDAGLDYKGYNIAIHELGHNVEQTITMNEVDHYLLNGVPNNAFTEAVAFMFQRRDLELLGMKNSNAQAKNLYALDNFWSTAEIMAVSLVDMRIWKWMYANPEASPEELKENVIRIAKEVWNEYFAAAFEIKDSPILAIYSHMISYPLYLAAYPLGHLIEFQLESAFAEKNFSEQLTEVLQQGRLTPNVWMKRAVDIEISAKPTLEATREALSQIQKRDKVLN